MLQLGLQAYLDDLCPGCGWPRTYSMHKDAKQRWQAGDGRRCWPCTATAAKQEHIRKTSETRAGAYYGANPDQAMVHAMADPILTYPPSGMGASGVYYGQED